MDTERKVAIVTGSARPWGLGREVALGLARKGFAIAVVDIHDEWGADAVRALREEAGGPAIYVRTDVSRREDVEAMMARVIGEFGRLDALVNVAAIVRNEPVEDLRDETFDRVIDINLRGTALCCQAAIAPLRAAGGGRIVNTASGGAFQPGRGLAVYAASKAGVIAFSRVLALELARDNIVVTVVSPGYMHTGMGSEGPPTQEQWERLSRGQPFKRPLYPREVADVIIYAATNPSHVLTGQTLHAYGGGFMV